jgi:plastocyanin
MRSRTLALLALAAVPALAACGSDDNGGSATSAGGGMVKYQTKTDSKASKPVAVVPAAADIKVNMNQSQFAPAAITAKVGQKIVWTNSDPIAHTVTATENAKFDSGTLEAGANFSYVTKKAGTISYVCEFHPGMTGTITVQ